MAAKVDENVESAILEGNNRLPLPSHQLIATQRYIGGTCGKDGHMSLQVDDWTPCSLFFAPQESPPFPPVAQARVGGRVQASGAENKSKWPIFKKSMTLCPSPWSLCH